MTEIKDIVGSGKGGGSQRTPIEEENTLQSDSIISTLEILSEGEIEGLVNGRQSIYFDDIPIDNDDGTKNYNVETDWRYGLPDQSYMSGWPSSETLQDVNLDIKTDLPAIYTVTNPDADAVKIIIALPNGLTEQKNNGDLVGTDVGFSVYVAGASGVYQPYSPYTISGKTTSPYYRTYRIDRPLGITGYWSIKVTRTTPDSDKVKLQNATKLASVVEIQDVKLPFNDTAYVGLKVSAKSTSNKIPIRSYRIKGIKVQIPVNYDPITATYSGQWDGSFKLAWTDNPAWILYDILTNDRYGCGRWIAAEDIDVFSFYDAAVYNDQLVPDGKGGLERRFTFNGVISNQDDAVKVIQNLAGAFNAVMLQEGRLYRLQQDRPSSPVAIINNSNVIDGEFVYSGSPHQGRHTVVNVVYNDINNKYREQITTVEADPTEMERYNGITKIDIRAVGAVTESQAKRAGKWYIETELRQKEVVKFSISFNGFDLRIGDVVKIADRNYTTIDNSGRIVNVIDDGSNYIITIDRDVTVSSTNTINYIDVNNQFASYDVNLGSSGKYINIPKTSPQPKIGGAFSIETAISNRQFRITGYSQKDKNVIEFTAIQYDPNKYARVEQGINIPSPVYSASIYNDKVNAPTNIKFGVNAYVNDESIRRDLVVSWEQSVNSAINDYTISWRVNGGNWLSAKTLTASYDITNIIDGVYDVKVLANGVNGVSSRVLTGTYTYTLNGGTGSLLNPVTNLRVKGTSGTTFTSKNLDIQFTNPATNVDKLAVIKDFRIDIKSLADNVVSTVYVDRVGAGVDQYYTYTFDNNSYDFGTPQRSFKVTVYCRDTDNKLSVGTTATFNNQAPVAPQVTVKAGVRSLLIETNISTDTDYSETVICASDATFTPSLTTNVVYRGPATFYLLQGVITQKYVACAHIDSFGVGAFSPIATGTPTTTAGIPSGSTLPTTPTNNEYSYYLDVATSDKGLYGWNGSQWIKATDLTNATGKISTTQINDNAITTPKIATNSITSSLIVAGAVTADKLSVNNLSAINANMGAITSGSITLDSAGFIRGGATSYSVGTGIWQGYDGGAYKWRVGTPGSSRAEYNGTAFNIYDAGGNLTISSGVVDYSKISGKPTSLSGINSTEANKLAGVQDGATNGATIGVNLSGQITSTNASTYIANAAIGSAQIGSIALVGTNNFSVKTATSGERIEIDGQVIKVFDANGVLRVRLGNLSV